MSTINTDHASAIPYYRFQRTDTSMTGTEFTQPATDTVEISSAARSMSDLQQEIEQENERTMMELKEVPPLITEEAKAAKTALDAARDSRTKLDQRIRDILSKHGISIDPGIRMNIGVGSGGRIGVSMDDKEKAKEIEKILNGEKGLAKEIRENQEVLSTAKTALQKALPTSLSVDSLVKILNGGSTEGNPLIPEGMSAQEAQDLLWVDAFAADPELLESFKGVYLSTDISLGRDNNYLTDPKEALRQLGSKAMGRIASDVSDYNRQVRMDWGSDLEEVEKRLVSLKDVEIFMDGSGMVETNGNFGKDTLAEKAGKAIVDRVMKGIYEQEKDEFEESLFKRAAERMVDQHDDEFGDAGQTPHTSMVRILNASVDVYVSAPEAEAELQGEIAIEVNQLLDDEGITLDSPLEVAVDDQGKIRAVNLPQDEAQRKKIESLLDQLTKMVTIEANQSDEEKVILDKGMDGTAKRLAPLMRHLAAHRPGGDTWYFQKPANQAEAKSNLS